MFALLAIVAFLLAVFEAPIGINLIALGLVFVAGHLLVGLWPLGGRLPR
jgi:hypothetical protein